jgi:ElaB/YqjD/DUF883 family membrane-anchored ribosome-binding protein
LTFYSLESNTTGRDWASLTKASTQTTQNLQQPSGTDDDLSQNSPNLLTSPSQEAEQNVVPIQDKTTTEISKLQDTISELCDTIKTTQDQIAKVTKMALLMHKTFKKVDVVGMDNQNQTLNKTTASLQDYHVDHSILTARILNVETRLT